MKIAHVITGLRKAAGTSTFCGEVCNRLVALGHEVTIAVCDPGASNTYPLDPRIHLVSMDDLEAKSTPTPFTYTLIHIHGLWTPVLHKVSRWAHEHSIPVVWSTHGMTAPWALRHKWWKKCLPWHLYQKRDLMKARMIHCTSDFEVEWNQKLGFERTVLAPLGTFLPEVGVVGVGNRCRGTEDVKTLLFVGRIYPVKALDRLIEAFGKARERGEGEQWMLRLVGPDQAGHTAELERICANLGLGCSTSNLQPSTSIVFAGPKYGEDLEREYENCTALALVSHTENFGATVVDAMAHGKPVITSTHTPWKVVADQDCGWWVDNDVETLANALRELFSASSSRLASMGQNGRKLVESHFTWSAVAKKMVEAYEEAQHDCEFAPCGSCEKCYDTCSPERIIR